MAGSCYLAHDCISTPFHVISITYAMQHGLVLVEYLTNALPAQVIFIITSLFPCKMTKRCNNERGSRDMPPYIACSDVLFMCNGAHPNYLTENVVLHV